VRNLTEYHGPDDSKIVLRDEWEERVAWRGLTLYEAGVRDPNCGAALATNESVDIEKARQLAKAGCPDELIVRILC
jgi:hypothetical protein